MNLVDKIKSDLVQAMKNQEKEKLTILRAIKGAMQLENINNKKEINDELAIEVIAKQIKMANDSIKEFEKGNRADLIEAATKEIEFLKTYLPKQLSKEEIVAVLDEIFDAIKPTGPKDMGNIMREVTPRVKGKADMKEVSEIIKEKLNNI